MQIIVEIDDENVVIIFYIKFRIVRILILINDIWLNIIKNHGLIFVFIYFCDQFNDGSWVFMSLYLINMKYVNLTNQFVFLIYDFYRFNVNIF